MSNEDMWTLVDNRCHHTPTDETRGGNICIHCENAIELMPFTGPPANDVRWCTCGDSLESDDEKRWGLCATDAMLLADELNPPAMRNEALEHLITAAGAIRDDLRQPIEQVLGKTQNITDIVLGGRGLLDQLCAAIEEYRAALADTPAAAPVCGYNIFEGIYFCDLLIDHAGAHSHGQPVGDSERGAG